MSSKSFGSSYVPSYFSIEDILATQQRVKCQFETKAKGMGFLDPSTDSADLPEGTKLDLPLWLARGVSGPRRRIISIEMPKAYGQRYRDILKADARVVDLHKLGPYFYELGAYLLEFDPTDAPDTAQTLIQVFKDHFRMLIDSTQNASDVARIVSILNCLERTLVLMYQVFKDRFRMLMDSTQNASDVDVTRIVSILDCLERTLFESGQLSATQHRQWLGKDMTDGFKKKNVTRIVSILDCLERMLFESGQLSATQHRQWLGRDTTGRMTTASMVAAFNKRRANQRPQANGEQSTQQR